MLRGAGKKFRKIVVDGFPNNPIDNFGALFFKAAFFCPAYYNKCPWDDVGLS